MADLPTDFALNQSLSTFALAAMQLLDPESDTYALDVLSVLESTLDDPRPVLRAQEFRAKGEAVAQMKADGVDYEERMDRLAEVTWPKPLADLLEGAYEMYAQGHPWVIEHDLRPKSVARQMSELAMTFGEFVATTSWLRPKVWCCGTCQMPTKHYAEPCPMTSVPRRLRT